MRAPGGLVLRPGEVLLDGLFVERLCLAFLDGDGVLGALAEAFAEPVAVDLADEPGHPVDDLERALGARGDALAAAVALLFIYVDDLPRRGHFRLRNALARAESFVLPR